MKIALLSGGVGGARLARGLARLPGISLTVIVNTGDDDTSYGLEVSPDLDTVLYTIAGVNGERGWGLADDDFNVMTHLAAFDTDTSFQIGDADLATKLFRTQEIKRGVALSAVTERIGTRLAVNCAVIPMSDQPIRTRLKTAEGWLSFREYFVMRQHRDVVHEISFAGASEARPAPGVQEAIDAADAIIIAPSNPVLSIWPILAVPGIRDQMRNKQQVISVSPLFGGIAIKGPAHDVLASLGLGTGNASVLAAYDGLVHDFVIDTQDAADMLTGPRIHIHDTRLGTMDASVAFADWLTTEIVT